MITLKDFFTATDYRITEGADHCWSCYGPKAYIIDSWDGDSDGRAASVTFSRDTQEVFEVSVCDYSKNKAWKWINPGYVEAYEQECVDRGVEAMKAWDNVDYATVDTLSIIVILEEVMKEGCQSGNGTVLKTDVGA